MPVLFKTVFYNIYCNIRILIKTLYIYIVYYICNNNINVYNVFVNIIIYYAQ